MSFERSYHRFDVDGNYLGYDSSALRHDAHAATVSVILPIYNAEPYLEQCLDSVQGQTYANLEIICVNDGSTDGSLKIIEAHAAADPRIVVIDKENEGYGKSCNHGLEVATGEWISIIEPDDWILEGMYADMLDFASGIDGAFDIIKTPYWRIKNPDTPREKRLACSYALSIHPKTQPFKVEDAVELISHHPSIWSALYRKSFLDEYGIRFKPIPGAGWADNPFLIETMLQTRGIVYLDKAYYCYRADTRDKEKAFSQRNPQIPFERWDEMTDIIERLGITDKRILEAHYNRGIMYMSGVIMHNDPDSPEMQALLKRMFDRMDPELVFASSKISPGVKKLYAKTRGIKGAKTHPVGYGASLVKKALYNLRNNGPAEMVESVGYYLHDHRSRIGK